MSLFSSGTGRWPVPDTKIQQQCWVDDLKENYSELKFCGGNIESGDWVMGQAQPFSSEPKTEIDHLAGVRRILADLEAGQIQIVKDGIEDTAAYILVLRTQIRYLETLLED